MSDARRESIRQYLLAIVDQALDDPQTMADLAASGAIGARSMVRRPRPEHMAATDTLAKLGLKQPPMAPVAPPDERVHMEMAEVQARHFDHPELEIKARSNAPKCANCQRWKSYRPGWGHCRPGAEQTTDLHVCSFWEGK